MSDDGPGHIQCHIDGGRGARRDKALVPFVEGRGDQRPQQGEGGAAEAQPKKIFPDAATQRSVPGAPEEQAERGVADKVSGLAEHVIEDIESGVGRMEAQPCEKLLQHAMRVHGGKLVSGFRGNDAQPYGYG